MRSAPPPRGRAAPSRATRARSRAQESGCRSGDYSADAACLL